jgi:hypothetical protein
MKIQTRRMVRELSSYNIEKFLINLHKYLKNNNMCFLNGSYIFEDFDRKLYNLLTHNSLVSKCLTGHKDFSDKISFHFSYTHRKFFENPLVEKDECVPYDQKYGFQNKFKYFKIERMFNEPLKYLCDIDNPKPKLNDRQTKVVALYYPFKYKDKIYLYLKLEGSNMNSPKHLYRLLLGSKSKLKESYPSRRENNKYVHEEDDSQFYKKIKQYNSFLEYNTGLRVGNEFFVPNQMLENILKN